MRRLFLLLPLALALAACGGSSNSSSGGSVIQTIRISEKEYSLSPGKVTLSKAGTYEFDVTNDGTTTHALTIAKSGGGGELSTGNIAPGSHKTLKFTFSSGQGYEMYCPIDSHKEKGMDGTIGVGGSAGGGGGSTTTTTSKPY